MLKDWSVFYQTAGGASAALIGLLFVGLSIHLDEVIRYRDIRASARGAFQSLVAILVVSLLILVPDIDDQALGWTLVGLGVSGTFYSAIEVRAMVGADLLLGAAQTFRRVGLRLAGLVLLIVDGVFFLGGNSDATLWVMASVFILLASSAQTAWLALINIAELTREESGGLDTSAPTTDAKQATGNNPPRIAQSDQTEPMTSSLRRRARR